ncbi:hypothetical protein I3760_08G070200 [Carya illinoinensis]|uniref:BZIP domain-containing protein n=1 Tax=Carya illinoinensis TaxID=32201 RepID=A0A922JCF7_CARIL|nr:hypothetical protein I3760_08G070200 [Carya illinoinensis]KAG6699504.1 hypothetical protein I3842_08G070000 [Carya illinoinensis]
MRNSTGAINHNGRNGNSISPYKSFSTGNQPCPSPYTASSPVIATPPARKFVEDVWKDIILASLHDPPYNTTLSSTVITTTTHKPACLLRKDRPTRFASSSSTGDDHSSALETTLLGSPAPPPATILSMKSGSDFAYLQSSCTTIGPNPRLQRHVSFTTPSFVSSFNSLFDVCGSSLVLPTCCKRRAQENDDNPGDRRNKCMIKNRESAARSRARKRAYTSELKLEVARLQEENARLERQQRELCVAANAHFRKNHRIYRTSTAPFLEVRMQYPSILV